METQNLKKEKMQVVKVLVPIVFFGLFFQSCKVQKGNKQYVIETLKSNNNSNCYLTLEAFHFEDPRGVLPVSFIVNSIIMNDNILEKKTIPILPGQFKVKALFPGKVENEILLSAKKGDSINIKIYLKDDPEPLHPYPDVIIPKNN